MNHIFNLLSYVSFLFGSVAKSRNLSTSQGKIVCFWLPWICSSSGCEFKPRLSGLVKVKITVHPPTRLSVSLCECAQKSQTIVAPEKILTSSRPTPQSSAKDSKVLKRTIEQVSYWVTYYFSSNECRSPPGVSSALLQVLE